MLLIVHMSELEQLRALDDPAAIESYLGDNTVLGKVISRVESRDDEAMEALRHVARPVPECHVIGVTGPPGAGKSTLVDKLVERFRERGLTVGVIAVDPRSDITGGAFLGDRVRLERSSTDESVFYRSLSTSGSITGTLASSTVDVLSVLDAAGMDIVVIETVGAGQTDTEIASIADSVLLVLPPGGGDQIQLTKAGILEIGDVFVVNKADLPGAGAFAADLRDHILRKRTFDSHADEPDDWDPPIVKTIATEGVNIDKLIDTIDSHRAYLDEMYSDSEQHTDLVRSMLELQLEREIRDELSVHLADRGGLHQMVNSIAEGERNVYDATKDTEFSIR
jgi:LAO/AO transport system kinase